MASEGMFCKTGGVSVGDSQHGNLTIWAAGKQWPPHRKLLVRRIPSCLGSDLLLLTGRKCGAFDAHPLPGHLKQMWTFRERGRTRRTDILLQLWESASRDCKVWACASYLTDFLFYILASLSINTWKNKGSVFQSRDSLVFSLKQH